MIRSAAFSFLLATGIPVVAETATITQSESFAIRSGTPLTPDGPLASLVFEERAGFDGFDPSLGELNSVSLLFLSSVFADGNAGCADGPFDCLGFGIQSTFFVFFPGDNDTIFDGGNFFPIADFPAGTSGVFVRRAGGLAGISGSATTTDETLLDRFLDPDVVLQISVASSERSGGLEEFFPTYHEFNGRLDLTYDFTPAPEIAPVPLPASVWLLLGGLGLLMAGGRACDRSVARPMSGKT